MLKKIIRKQMAFIALLVSMAICMVVEPLNVEAAGFSLSASTSSVSPNGTFSVSFGSGTVGQYSVSASGGSVISASTWVEGGSGSAKIKAGSSGSVTVTVSANNVTTSSYEDVTGSRSVTVKIKSPSSSGGSSSGGSNSGGSSSGGSSSSGSSSNSSNSNNSNTPEIEQDTRSKDNNLKALSINGVALSPKFSAGKTSYTAEVLDVEKLTISATKNDSKASVSGTGEKSLDLGKNTFKIVVTAENGAKKTYQITVVKNESPTVFMDYNGQSLGVVKNIFDLKAFPSFDKCELEYNGEEIYGWYSTPLDMTVVYLVDEEEAEGFYVYKDGVVTSQLHLVTLNGTDYFVFGLSDEEQARTGFVYDEITIGKETIMGWSFESDQLADYKIIQLMKEDGETNEYLYSLKDKTYILSPNFAPLTEEDYVALVDEMNTHIATSQEQAAEIDSLETIIGARDTSISKLKSLAIVLSVLILVLIIALVVSLMKLKKQVAPADLEVVEEYSLLEDSESFEGDELE